MPAASHPFPCDCVQVLVVLPYVSLVEEVKGRLTALLRPVRATQRSKASRLHPVPSLTLTPPPPL